MGEMNSITPFCFAMEVLGLEKHILGNKEAPGGIEEKSKH